MVTVVKEIVRAKKYYVNNAGLLSRKLSTNQLSTGFIKRGDFVLYRALFLQFASSRPSLRTLILQQSPCRQPCVSHCNTLVRLINLMILDSNP